MALHLFMRRGVRQTCCQKGHEGGVEASKEQEASKDSRKARGEGKVELIAKAER